MKIMIFGSMVGTLLAPKTYFKKNFRPAVNRQPMFPREMTRRADSACPPTNSHSELSRGLQRTRSKNKRKRRFSMKIVIFGVAMKTLSYLGRCSNKFCGTSPSGKTFLKLAARGRPSTMVSAGWTRREGVSIAYNSSK